MTVDTSSVDPFSLRVLYAGRVQGVGFRYTTANIAASHPVRGYVRNLPGGEVEVLVQGSEPDVRRFLAAVAQRFDSNIRSVREEPAAGQETFADFQIRR